MRVRTCGANAMRERDGPLNRGGQKKPKKTVKGRRAHREGRGTLSLHRFWGMQPHMNMSGSTSEQHGWNTHDNLVISNTADRRDDCSH